MPYLNLRFDEDEWVKLQAGKRGRTWKEAIMEDVAEDE